MRISLILAVLVLAGCQKKPVACNVADAASGSTPDIFGFGKETTTVELVDCADGAKRRIACRQALSGGFKCECVVTQKNGNSATLELRTPDDLATTNAKDFARVHCDWKLE